MKWEISIQKYIILWCFKPPKIHKTHFYMDIHTYTHTFTHTEPFYWSNVAIKDTPCDTG